jgi:hypothetical protein
MATGQPEGDWYFDALDWLAGDAAPAERHDRGPSATTRSRGRRPSISSYRAHEAVQEAQTRLARIGKPEGSGLKLTVRGNLLSVASTQTAAQTRIIDECLDRSSTIGASARRLARGCRRRTHSSPFLVHRANARDSGSVPEGPGQRPPMSKWGRAARPDAPRRPPHDAPLPEREKGTPRATDARRRWPWSSNGDVDRQPRAKTAAPA